MKYTFAIRTLNLTFRRTEFIFFVTYSAEKGEEEHNLLWNSVSKIVISKGGDENILSKLKGILEKGNLIRDEILAIVISKDGGEDILSKLKGIVEQGNLVCDQ